MSLEFTDAELAAIRSEFCRGFTDDQFQVCLAFCRARNLMPGKHIVFNLRKSWEWDDTVGAKVENQKIVFITTIDAARLIAQRSKEYTGQGPEQYIYLDADGNPTIISEIPLPHPENRQLPREPWAVRTTIYRKGFDHPITSVARFDAYAVTRKLKSGEIVLTDMWQRRSPEMLAKCCEMLSLRKGYPEELANLYLDLEIKNEVEDEKPHAVTPASVVPLPPSVPAVNQVPAVGTDTPRPNEKMPPEIATKIVEALPIIEQLVENPTIQEKLAEQGLKINYPQIEKLKQDALAAVPDLKPASEIPEPKKRGRKPKESPDNGQSTSQNPPNEGDSLHKTTDGGITDEDIASAGKPAPEFDQAANQKAAEEFVAGTDPTPTPDEKKQLIARVRSLVDKKVAKGDDIKKRILTLSNLGETADYWSAPIRFWNQALEEEERKQANKLEAF